MTAVQSTNIVRQGTASPSALRVAILRAVHGLLDDPIVLNDPLALPILGGDLAARLRDDPFDYNDPLTRGLRAALVVRAQFVEDELVAAVAAGVQQYVVLGAGLDSFACRNPYQAVGLRVFEVDHPATQNWKRQALEQAGIAVPDSLSFVPVDFEQGGLLDALVAAGFRMDQPAVVSWLGVTMYLTEAAIDETLGLVASFAPGTTLIFDYVASPATLNPIEQAVVAYLSQRTAAQGEPWIASFEPAALRARLQQVHGFSMAETFEPADLNRRYLHRRKDGLRSTGRLARAVV